MACTTCAGMRRAKADDGLKRRRTPKRSHTRLTAGMLLVAFGVDRAEAQALAALDLPLLPPPPL
ncbi:MAG TPA: hypothetical protein VMU47_15480 [Caldimonas sp.]|nr:hypothetical protein [Caldimonas sp.]